MKGCQQRGSFQLGKTPNIQIFSTSRFSMHFKKIIVFEIFGKLTNVPVNMASHFTIYYAYKIS